MAEKGAVESVLNFVEDQQKRLDDKKKQKKEEAEAAERAAAESARIEREKTAAFVKKYWWALLAVLVVLVLMIAFGGSSGAADQTVHTTKPAVSSSNTKTVEPAAVVATAEPTSQELADRALESTFPVEKARRAAVVAITNGIAADVFARDGNTYAPSKFHSYADTSGKVDDYFLDVTAWGAWSAKDERTWHVDSLLLKHRLGQDINASLDVRFDGSKYVVSHVTGTRANGSNSMELSVERGPYASVPAELIKDDRSQAGVAALDHSGDLDNYAARTAFEEYGKAEYPYGFKCHWILDLMGEEHRSNGSWFFKVGVTITNQYGTKRDAVAEGVVSGTTDSPTVGRFLAY